MARVTYVEAGGESHTVDVPPGHTVMDGAMKNGIPGIEAECGGACACATCHCYVDPEWFDRFPAPKPEEIEMLEFAKSEMRATSRLSCQLRVEERHDGLVVRLPELQ
jgi:2Fe-2S ferredoxin